MTRATLLALADRVEALTGPCRETDERVGMGIGLKRTMRVGHECLGTDRVVPVMCPHYTASLDAALSLVPEGWGSVRFEQGFGGIGCFLNQHDTFATTPALALTAAALRARAMMETE